MATAPVKPYEGKEPYIFISYSHRDSSRVFPILKYLDEQGYRIWYDEGIDPGTEWPESIAEHLMGSQVCLAFVSDNSLASQNCRREINFALSRNQIGFLSVMLEDARMTPGVELQLSTYQSLLMYKYHDQEEFYNKLVHVDLLEPCKRPQPAAPVQTEPVQPAAPAPAAEKKPEPAAYVAQKAEKPEKTADGGGKNKKPLIIGIAAAAVAILVLVIVLVSRGGSDKDPAKEAADTSAAQEQTTKSKDQTEAATGAQTEAASEQSGDEDQTEPATEKETLPPGELSDDLADSTFKLDDVVYQLPFAFTQLTENGWTISSSGVSDQTMVTRDDPLSFEMVRNGASIEVTAVNVGAEDLAVADCQIGEIEVQQYDMQDPERFCVAKGITLFSTLEEIQEAFGPGAALSTRSTYVRMSYGVVENNRTVFDYYPETAKYNMLTVTHYPTAPQAERLSELSDDPADYTFLLDDVLYQLPFPFTQLTDNGWTISSSGTSDKTPVGGYQDLDFEMTKNGATITVYAINASGSARPIKESPIGGIQVQLNDMPEAERFCVAKHITLSSTLDDITSALGEGDDLSTMSTYTAVSYGEDSSNRTRILVYSDTVKYNQIEMKNYPSDPEPTETVLETPAYLAAYAAPTELGDNLFSGNVEIDGDLYRLPTPLSAFLDNGWTYIEKPGFVASYSRDTAILKRSEATINVYLENFSEVQTVVENCVVTQIYIEQDAAVPFALPQDVKLGTRKSVVDELELGFYVSEYKDYFYYNTTSKETNVFVGLRIDTAQEQVESLRLEHRDWDY